MSQTGRALPALRAPPAPCEVSGCGRWGHGPAWFSFCAWAFLFVTSFRSRRLALSDTVLVSIYSDNFQIAGRQQHAAAAHMELRREFGFSDEKNFSLTDVIGLERETFQLPDGTKNGTEGNGVLKGRCVGSGIQAPDPANT